MRIKILTILLLAAPYPAPADTLTVGPSARAGYDYSNQIRHIPSPKYVFTLILIPPLIHQYMEVLGRFI
jgi:hypothetical protein